jgi:formylglycine-generating enzyme required for sulfatase activity
MTHDIQRQIAELEASLSDPMSEPVRRLVEQQIAALRQQASPVVDFSSAQTGAVSMGDVAGGDVRKGIEGDVSLADDAMINGVAVGVNLGTIIYQRNPSEDERRRLVWYLHALAGDLRRLPLRGLDPALADGRGVDLARVYVMLATTAQVALASESPEQLARCFRDGKVPQQTAVAQAQDRLVPAHDPAVALPDAAVISLHWRDRVPNDGSPGPTLTLSRAGLATEAVAQQPRLVLLGDPGGGKSTFLRHLAWVLARRGLDQLGPETELFGWNQQRRRLPLLLPLRRLAGMLATADAGAQTVYQALRDVVTEAGVRDPDDLLTDALVRGAAILLLDGLDEVPVDATPTSASREATVRAVRAFAERYGRASVVLTCRTRAFTDALQDCLGWPVETLAPFTLGQVRHFVPAWYAELVAAKQLTADQTPRLSTELVDTIAANQRLRTMAATPLLLTLMALLLVRRGTLPRDRPRLYEEILELLLGQWDKVRDGQSLAEVIGRPDWTSERLRPLLDRLSYEAHLAGSSMDGRGRLERGRVRDALIDFFETAQVPEPWSAARRCLDYFEQRSGLLSPDGDESYVFAHLTLQEHCAGRHLLLSRDAVRQVLLRRGEDRWREPIFLGLGVVQATNPYLVEKVLRMLVDQREEGAEKPTARWYRDLILAAELGKDRDWAYLRDQEVDVPGLQADLRAGFVALLADREQPVPVAERVRAGALLGELGDPRVPVTAEDWQTALMQRNECFGQSRDFWCYVRGGTYQIGGWRAGGPQAAITLSAFWVARYPITVAQYEPFVAVGYGPDAERWWTPQGWQWKQRRRRTEPWGWDDPTYRGPNQPVVGINWYEATAYCAWLTEQVQNDLPTGYVVRLPSEAEWEVAAAYDGQGQRRSYPWGEQEPTPELAIYDASTLSRPAPVGCCPAGAAACGALDMAGNVWEWTCSQWEQYPAQSGVVVTDFQQSERYTEEERVVPLRGGSWLDGSSSVRCGARLRGHPLYDVVNYYRGGRVILAPLGIADRPIADRLIDR